MNRAYVYPGWILAAIMLAAVLSAPVTAATVPEYSITYTITVSGGEAAVWQVEYRTLLSSDEDTAVFEAYSENIESTYLPEFRTLMERSVAQAAVATSRTMKISDFSGTSDIQASPTGKYGVILYSFTWEGFTKPGNEMVIGDTFVGGMYLPRDATLIIRYPSGYRVKSAEPAPDLTRDDLTWYGQRSFGAGEPRVVLEQDAFPVVFILAGLAVVVPAGAVVVMAILKKRRRPVVTAEPAVSLLSDAGIISLEERILQMIRANGGEMYQSDIVKNLNLPKSTVSNALNDLHARKLILKVKKGRENLIRLAP